MTNVIGFVGAIGSGKTTAQKRLQEAFGFSRVRFAGPLKDMMRALGLSEAEIDGDLKEKPCALLGGKSPRYAMQTIGTEWGRGLIDSDLWINAWRRAVTAANAICVVADDCRFPNEAAAIRALGGKIVRITGRAGDTSAAAHASEGQPIEADIEIENTGDLAAFYVSVDDLPRRLFDWCARPRWPARLPSLR
ncbi:MAG TPA: deoxynucleotide monophosphate kinase [Xanthobacteraceae bacterium]|nr:deoxynucleotide monophosphate kinase [Xanthobacteraceae bacterium]